MMVGVETSATLRQEPDRTSQEAQELLSQRRLIELFGKVKGVFGRVTQTPGWINDRKLAAALGLILTVSAAACGGGEKGPAITPTTPWQPTIGPTVEAIITPTVTSTPTREPTLPPTPEPAKPPPPKPTVQPTPTPTELPPKPQGNWLIEVDPKIREEISPQKIEEDLKRIQAVIDKFPQPPIGNLKIILTSGSVSATVLPQNPEELAIIYIGQEAFLLERRVADELASFFDVMINEARLASYFAAEDLSRLKILREEIVSKYRNFPSIERMFSPKKFGDTPLRQYTAYPDTIYIGQAIEHEVSGIGKMRYPLDEPLFTQFLDQSLFKKFAKEVEGIMNNYRDIGQFLQGEVARIAELKQSSPFHRLALDLLQKRSPFLTRPSSLWTADGNVYLDAKWLSEYWEKVVPVLENMVLTEALAEENPELLQLLTPQQQKQLREAHDYLFQVASDELFARVYSRWLSGVDDGENPVQRYHNIILSARR